MKNRCAKVVDESPFGLFKPHLLLLFLSCHFTQKDKTNGSVELLFIKRDGFS